MKPFYVLVSATIVLSSFTPSAETTAQTAPPRSPQLNCLAPYPATPGRGDRPLTRYEFAAGLNACLEEVRQGIPDAGLATRADLEALIQRQQDLNQQLRGLRDRVDSLDAPTPSPQP